MFELYALVSITSDLYLLMINKNRYSLTSLKESSKQKPKREQALSSRELEDFFSKQVENNNVEIVLSLTENVQSKVESDLNDGIINISPQSATEQSQSLSNILHLNHQKHKLERELQLLNHLIQSEKFKPIRTMNSSKLTSDDHLQVMKKIRKEKREIDSNRELYVKELQQKKEQNEIRDRQQSQKERIRLKEEKRNRISSDMKIREEKKKLEKSSSLDKSKINKKLLYRELQSKYIKEVVLPAIQERNTKIKEIKIMKRPIRIEEIRKHEEDYMRRREEVSSLSLSKRQNPKPYSPSFKSSRLQKMRMEEEELRRANQEEKKVSLSTRVERIESFKRYVADNFKPAISESKRRELSEKILQQTTKPRSNSTNPYQRGNEYMTYSKSVSRKQISSRNPQSLIDIQTANEKLRPNSNKANFFSPNPKAVIPTKLQKVENILKSTTLSSKDKLEELKLETEILGQMISEKDKLSKVKELREKGDNSGLLLASIKARIGMLEMYNQ